MQICNMMNVAADDFFTFQVRRRQPLTVFAFAVFMHVAVGLQPPRRSPARTNCMDSHHFAAVYA